ncbi:hypothetical protein OVA24_16170 [Luteolibacter sp. SL250]|uniref:hypothetical protein n=1 Tax=Luteolibacter sp. SL250 TaxID=2995170 RepID=UPI00226E4F47|nr:hypothetical protein [Luteolibacter sp. SL250]WAC18766.1 hypothetical protein OVA24_16170 [Luteolibacter sp. SL250]
MKNMDASYYENWLSLDKGERMEDFLNWNTYEGEGFPIAIMALARLVGCSPLPVTTANVGIYHGGTYLLKVTLKATWDGSHPDALVEEFEGLPVIWTNHGNEWIGGFRMG